MVSNTKSPTRRTVSESARVRIVPAEAWHCFAVGAKLRPDDLMEVRHASGDMDPGKALDDSRLKHPGTMAALVGGMPVVIFGCHAKRGVGVPWMVAAREVDRMPVLLTRSAKRIVSKWKERYGTLANTVWSESRAVGWLPLLGFRIEEAFQAQCFGGGTATYRWFRMD